MGTKSSYYLRRRLLLAGFLIGFGTLALLDQIGVLQIHSIWHYLPLILVLAGINRLIGYPNPRRVLKGLWLIFLGGWLFVSLEQIWGLTFSNSWPLLLIALGTGLILAPFLRARYWGSGAVCNSTHSARNPAHNSAHNSAYKECNHGPLSLF